MSNLVKVTLVNSPGSPYSQSRPHDTEKLNKELANDYEKRTWMNRMHKDKDGRLFIPAMAFKNCIGEAAKFLSMQVPGKGKSTFTKHFESGVLVPGNAYLRTPGTGQPILASMAKDEKDIPAGEPTPPVYGSWIFTPSDGVRGSGKRVWKCYPLIPQWEADVTFVMHDDMITEPVFRQHLEQAGMLIGVGRFRFRNMGTYGGFQTKSFDWLDYRDFAPNLSN